MVLVHATSIGHGRCGTELCSFEFTAHTVHARSVGKDLGGILFVFGIFDKLLVFACPSLSNTAECEDQGAEKKYTADGSGNDVFCRVGKTVPFLFHGLCY
jgi:hypothetical protein